MFEEFCKKMTWGMAWVIVAPTAILIVALSCLVGAYIYVIIQADELSFEVPGKFIAKMNHFAKQLGDEKALNTELMTVNGALKKALSTQESKCRAALNSEPLHLENSANVDIFFNRQSQLLEKQKDSLNAISEDFMKFQKEVESYKKSGKN